MPRLDPMAVPALSRAALALLLAMAFGAPRAGASEGSRLAGRVVDAATLAPIAGAEIELANMNAGQGFYRVRSDAKGAFTIERVAPDRTYGLTVSAPGYADFVLSGWQFPAPQRSAEVVIPLDRAGSLEVRALRADGRTAVANARVSVRTERGERWWEGFRPPPAPVFTDASGAARFVDLEAGSWTVTAESPGLLPSETRQVIVRRGETTSVPATLVKAASLAGVVRLRDGTPLPSITVTARGPGEGVGTSGPDGAFAIEGLAPGRYRLEVNPEGFDAWRSEETYRLDEGASRGDLVVTVTPKAPELAVVLEREALVPGTSMTVEVRSFRVDSVGLALFEIPAPLLVDPARDFRQLAEGGSLDGLPLAKRWVHRPGEGAPFTWRDERVPLPDSLRTGAYLLVARSGGLDRRAIFFVTDLGILVKRSLRHTLVWAATLRRGTPVGDVSIYVVPPASAPGVVPGRVPGFRVLPGRFTKGGLSGQGWSGALRAIGGAPQGRSDSRGVAAFGAGGAPDQARIVAVSAEHGIAVAESPLAQAAREGGDRVYLYTERPIYRPGQTVFWKLFARRGADSAYALPRAGAKAQMAVIGPDGASRAVASDSLSSSGSADGSFVVPADAPLGDWRVAATVGAATAGAGFAVQEYRKPEFRVEVTPDREVYLNGDEIRFIASARYFFGAPVFGAVVRYNLFETRLSEAPAEEEGEDEDEAVT
ncbi:MAG TPA: carboxypeptidase regulatory-like domain-containing protein, partial [Candidatus Omnitrophota bacterium]|nr:carboxypeptidase regulatory-like domain-containing protein [Candidatus Omnitrophota bacterium]